MRYLDVWWFVVLGRAQSGYEPQKQYRMHGKQSNFWMHYPGPLTWALNDLS